MRVLLASTPRLRCFGLTAVLLMLMAMLVPVGAEASCLPASIQQKLAEIKAKFGPVKIVSAHRPGARIAGSGRKSYHASCRAVDFMAPKGQYQAVVAWLKQTHSGGVGTYSCGMHHIHLDNGPKIRFHKCQGGGRYIAKTLRGGKSRQYAQTGSSTSKKSSKRASRINNAGYVPVKATIRYGTQRSPRVAASAGSITDRAVGGFN